MGSCFTNKRHLDDDEQKKMGYISEIKKSDSVAWFWQNVRDIQDKVFSCPGNVTYFLADEVLWTCCANIEQHELEKVYKYFEKLYSKPNYSTRQGHFSFQGIGIKISFIKIHEPHKPIDYPEIKEMSANKKYLSLKGKVLKGSYVIATNRRNQLLGPPEFQLIQRQSEYYDPQDFIK